MSELCQTEKWSLKKVPGKTVMAGPVVPATLPVAECNIAGPVAGTWTLTVTAGALPPATQPTEYALAAHAI